MVMVTRFWYPVTFEDIAEPSKMKYNIYTNKDIHRVYAPAFALQSRYPVDICGMTELMNE